MLLDSGLFFFFSGVSSRKVYAAVMHLIITLVLNN